MSNKFFAQRTAAIRDYLYKPCEFEDCGQPSNFVAINGAEIYPVCLIHIGRARLVGYEIKDIPTPEYKPLPKASHE